MNRRVFLNTTIYYSSVNNAKGDNRGIKCDKYCVRSELSYGGDVCAL